MSTEYSGQTTHHHGQQRESWRETPGAGKDCIQQVTVFNVQWSNCPVEVETEVRQLWRDNELGNDRYFYPWNDSEEERNENGESQDSEEYPIIAEYLRSRGVTKCWIQWWW